MFLLILLVLGLVVLIFWIRRYTIQENYQEDKKSVISPQQLLMYNDSQLSQTAYLGYKMEGKNRINSNYSAPQNITLNLPNILQELLSDTVHVLVGRYKLVNQIPELKNRLSYILRTLLQTYSSEIIYEQFHPRYSNEFLLEGCRELMTMSLEPLSKILLAQFIASRSNDGNEIGLMYNYISNIAIDRTQIPELRMNAADILNLSNNRRLMNIANSALESLRESGDQINPTILQNRIQSINSRFCRSEQPSVFNENIHRPLPIREDLNTGPLITTGAGTWVRTEGPQVQQQVQQQVHQQVQQAQQQIQAQNQNRVPRTIQEQLIYIQDTITPVKTVAQRSLYGDTQNVHTSAISRSSLKAASELIKKHSPASPISFDNKLVEGLSSDTKIKIDKSLHRLLTDTSSFSGAGDVTLYSTFQSVLNYISKHASRDELNKRLIEELIEMSGLCATGCLTRLINIFQGIDKDQNLFLRIDITDEVYGTVKHRIEKELERAPNSEELLDSLGSDKKEITRWVNDLRALIEPELLTSYAGTSSPEEVKQALDNACRKWLAV